ncbi:hypothetical protein DdX_06017 [Ditylenchus destructor]|uniref:Uncharacterized protein n=1 Tax=Ditylenchus destructor TaxID=166010 RepID=A0AAD4N6U1_9BILA|nr:hypothetical protein DdX_06017 [Ditylenchus destructor]
MATGQQRASCFTTNVSTQSYFPYDENNATQILKQCTSIGSDFYEEEYDPTCCFGKLNIMTWLQIISLVNLLLDGGCTFLSIGHVTCYIFAASTAISLLSLCSVISGVQEERKLMIKFPALWAVCYIKFALY